METSIAKIHENFYIIALQHLKCMHAYWLPITVANNYVRYFSTEGISNILNVVVMVHIFIRILKNQIQY